MAHSNIAEREKSRVRGGGSVHMGDNPGVLQQKADSRPARCLLVQGPSDEVGSSGRQPLRNFRVLIKDRLDRALPGGHSKWWAANEQLKGEDSTGPCIHLVRVGQASVVFVFTGLALVRTQHHLCRVPRLPGKYSLWLPGVLDTVTCQPGVPARRASSVSTEPNRE
jgi:hypothetical protein